jgi:hypothetical protein
MYQPPSRTLWLTDTLMDDNPTSATLQSIRREVRERDLPIDFLTCHPSLAEEDHLLVMRPVAEIRVPSYRAQPIRLPDLFELLQKFRDGSYDRIVCSTELIMGLLALFLKNCFSVPGYFYVHNDWLDLMERSQRLDQRSADRIRRLLRALYRSYDGLLLSDREQADWFAGPALGIPRGKIFDAVGWADQSFRAMDGSELNAFDAGDKPGGKSEQDPAPSGSSLLNELLDLVSQG